MNEDRNRRCSAVCVTYNHFTELPAWQAAREYKLAIYRLCSTGALASQDEPRGQLRRSVAKPPALIAEASEEAQRNVRMIRERRKRNQNQNRNQNKNPESE